MTPPDPQADFRPGTERSVLITGCSSGIGYTCAHGLARRGWRVIASARRTEDVMRLQGEGLTAVRLDLDDPDSIAQALAQTLDLTGGTLDALFNNAAFGLPGAVEDLTRAALRAQLETNVLGWHDLTCRVIPIMRRQGYGRIVQNSSILGLMALPYRGAYVASKFALEGLTDTLRLELAGSGIAVCLIEPGPILSRFRENAHRAFKAHIDTEHSVHRDAYRQAEARLTKEGAALPFTLPPEAVLKRLIHALESRRPHPRYYVTFPTHLFGVLRRVLGTRALDWVLRRISGGGAR
ncbi:SDR family oxidoreductase [Candidatus Thiodictyon syntrophicum]|jgi:NAD(P)-dependent dehydrogenase (short-subunit alcohol dehydrogenase family)|uniref:Short-chain dehydrogenase n=1 Tax=Candidatus Thiodictyon syntrophicum TaxID=1166950 RepID=A0A2K8U4B4_9GAMM|nr:SDR family oxidoreductase [Candidatus Thiodictyon syntrophicum]AUB80422.1 short-chain dehydrogenase [Candidatus Thiodictyon syntrophicum]